MAYLLCLTTRKQSGRQFELFFFICSVQITNRRLPMRSLARYIVHTSVAATSALGITDSQKQNISNVPCSCMQTFVYLHSRYQLRHFRLTGIWQLTWRSGCSSSSPSSILLADRTNGRAIATLLRLSSSVCRLSVTLCIVAKRCVLEQKLLWRAYRKSYMRNRLVPKWMTLTFV